MSTFLNVLAFNTARDGEGVCTGTEVLEVTALWVCAISQIFIILSCFAGHRQLPEYGLICTTTKIVAMGQPSNATMTNALCSGLNAGGTKEQSDAIVLLDLGQLTQWSLELTVRSFRAALDEPVLYEHIMSLCTCSIIQVFS